MKHQKIYPCISLFINRSDNVLVKCKCGEIGKLKAIVQIDYFRINDESVWVCDKHATKMSVMSLYFNELTRNR